MEGQRRSELLLGVLGRLRVERAGAPVDLGPLKQRLVLAALLACPNRPVPLDGLTEAVWRDEPPRTARKNLQVYVSTLRTLLDPGAADRIVYDCGGYRLRAGREELDLLRFEDLMRAGRNASAAGDRAAGAELFGRALRLWRGEPFADLRAAPLIAAEAARLEQRRVAAVEDWAEAELDRGGAPGPVAEVLAEQVERHPLRERLQAGWIDALRRSGRQAEALAEYDRYRRRLAGELGLTPSPVLTALYNAMLGGGRAVPPVGRPCQALPPDTADFTGRAEQLERLLEVLDGGGTAVVTGPAGLGKTTLAVRAAYRAARRFPDGRLLVRMRTPDGAARTLPDVLGELDRLTGFAPAAVRRAADPERLLESWRAWLEDRRVLLVLDDAADESLVRLLLPADAAGAAIVTASRALAGLAPVHRVDLAPFDDEETLDLLGRIVGPRRLAAEIPAARRIAAACGGAPLAVRAGGLKLAVLRHLPLTEYAARLAGAAALDELAAGDVAVRPRLERGWRELAANQRAAMAALAGLPLDEPFTAQEAAAALGCAHGPAVRMLEDLVEAGMLGLPDAEVMAHTVLYELPRLLHLYAREHAG
ncbi:MAG TPA: BTAD domain-containing putative transcriptional regulator [Actinospica sp.]|nr:BTAD domain-containing putative transcriptional regulator [Actinospica sp.]